MLNASESCSSDKFAVSSAWSCLNTMLIAINVPDRPIPALQWTITLASEPFPVNCASESRLRAFTISKIEVITRKSCGTPWSGQHVIWTWMISRFSSDASSPVFQILKARSTNNEFLSLGRIDPFWPMKDCLQSWTEMSPYSVIDMSVPFQYWWALIRPRSTNCVSITITYTLCNHTIFQNSIRVWGKGAQHAI